MIKLTMKMTIMRLQLILMKTNLVPTMLKQGCRFLFFKGNRKKNNVLEKSRKK